MSIFRAPKLNYLADEMRTPAFSAHIKFNFGLLKHIYLRPDVTSPAVT